MRQYIFYCAVACIFSCSTNVTSESSNMKELVKDIEIGSPKNFDTLRIGDTLFFELILNSPDKIKNLELLIQDTLYCSNLKKSQILKIDTKNAKVGSTKVELRFQDETGAVHREFRQIFLLSDLSPKNKHAVIVSSFPHNRNSYTQGLEFYDGRLYESTGLKGKSMLGEVDLTTGIITKKIYLNKEIFGEGITIIHDKIYQLTWMDGKCFVYDLKFNKITELYYSGEGWGLCNNGTSLIMTNGSNEIVWRDTSFNILKRIFVCNDKQTFDNLNELELINGNLFINVYGENKILEVDTTTGKVLSEISCDNVEIDARLMGNDVLNGIAYNSKTGRIYITGKFWPNLYEVTFEE